MTPKSNKKKNKKKDYVKLNVQERFALLGVLPSQGDFVTLGIARSLGERIGFNAKDAKYYGIQVEGNGYKWDPKKDKPKEFEFQMKEEEIIRDVLEKLNKEKKLEARHFSIYEKFVVKK